MSHGYYWYNDWWMNDEAEREYYMGIQQHPEWSMTWEELYPPDKNDHVFVDLKDDRVAKKEKGKKDKTFHDRNIPDGIIRSKGYILYMTKEELKEFVPKKLQGTEREEAWIKFRVNKTIIKCMDRDRTWQKKGLHKKNSRRKNRRDIKKHCMTVV